MVFQMSTDFLTEILLPSEFPVCTPSANLCYILHCEEPSACPQGIPFLMLSRMCETASSVSIRQTLSKYLHACRKRQSNIQIRNPTYFAAGDRKELPLHQRHHSWAAELWPFKKYAQRTTALPQIHSLAQSLPSSVNKDIRLFHMTMIIYLVRTQLWGLDKRTECLSDGRSADVSICFSVGEISV